MKKGEDDFTKLYDLILNELNEGIHVIDAQGNTIIYNQKMMELESMQRDEVLNKHLLDVFQFHEGQDSTLLQALKGKKTTYLKQSYFNDKGKQITTINKTFPIMEGGKCIGAIEIANDVTNVERMINDNLNKKGNTRFTFDSIIGTSLATKEVLDNAQKASRTSSSVLIVGETGTGKELFAQSIHNASARSSGPFISQNCAALPDTLIESLLFGTTKGAFTGAIDRPGLFEQAEGGTLLLDEINSLSPLLQAKLLRVLQERVFRRIGDMKDKEANVRIIATMNEDPIDAIANNHLRRDLFYRLGVVTIFIPSLRERREDIPLLVDHFIQKYNRLFHMKVQTVCDDVKAFCMSYDWPGNVRELENVIEGAMNLAEHEQVLHYSHLPLNSLMRNARAKIESPLALSSSWSAPLAEKSGERLKPQMAETEKTFILKIIEKNGGNLSKSAAELGISRQSLQYRLRKYQLSGKN